MTELTASQVEQFHRQGYLVAEDILDFEQDLQPVIDEYTELLDRICTDWYAQGKLSSSFSELPFGKRLVELVRETGSDYYRYFDIALATGKPITEESPIHLGPAVYNLLASERLLDAVESLIGPEISSHPVQHMRVKIPEHHISPDEHNSFAAATPWHQDLGVVMPEADETDMLSVWIPVTDATEENGCLAIAPETHRDELIEHCPTINIPDEVLDLKGLQPIPVPIRKSGLIFMHRQTVHGSLSNTSDDIRWSFDVRYSPTGQPSGRSGFPNFVVRSRSNPESANTRAEDWAEMWRETRRSLSGRDVADVRTEYYRFEKIDPGEYCA
jgi:ectoine hydroxylase-related dioxygenase (phytanoyl-CoA dioxygenase family)